MVKRNSLEPYRTILIAALCDVQTLHSEVFTSRALRLTIQKINSRCEREGIGFLTKTLPRLAKALDRALTGEVPLDCTKIAFRAIPGSKLPKLFGELFQCIFAHDGWILPTPCVKSIKFIRQILLQNYKLEIPYEDSQEQKVLEKFERTDRELGSWNEQFSNIRELLDADPLRQMRAGNCQQIDLRVVRAAKILLSRIFADFNPADIHPRHGPGAVSTRERLSGKYTFKVVSPRIVRSYPLDAYYYASLGHVCDELADVGKCQSCIEKSEGTSCPSFSLSQDVRQTPRLLNGCTRVCPTQLRESNARVLLVPKDSRGPRLISCEPLDFQWIQQGLGSAIVQKVESHPLTRWNVHFSDQTPNRCGAALGSITGGYATLDLNEASDRVSTELVRLLFPEPVLTALMNCRSESTELPDGRILKLNKFAPMGSALCFPILALTCWAILAVGLPDAEVRPCDLKPSKMFTELVNGKRRWKPREDFLVYGDDIVVKSAQAEHAMKLLESFGLVINRDKSCTSGFFRESCGMDAFGGVSVTPVRLRTCWSQNRCPEAYASYIAFANYMYELKFYQTYDKIVELLTRTYGCIPERGMFENYHYGEKRAEVNRINDPVPSLIEVPEAYRPKKTRVNPDLQKPEYLVWSLKTPSVEQVIGGWRMLLRFFAEGTQESPLARWNDAYSMPRRCGVWDHPLFDEERRPFSVSRYTKSKTSCLVKDWR